MASLLRDPKLAPGHKTKKSGLGPLFQEFSTYGRQRQGIDARRGHRERDYERVDGEPALLVPRLLVRSLDPGIVDQALDGLAALDMGLEDLLQIRLLHPPVPDVVGVDDHHRAMAALREAAGLVDPDVCLQAGLHRLVPQVLDELLDVALGRAGVAGRAHEDVALVLSHQSASTAAVFAAFRSVMNLST